MAFVRWSLNLLLSCSAWAGRRHAYPSPVGSTRFCAAPHAIAILRVQPRHLIFSGWHPIIVRWLALIFIARGLYTYYKLQVITKSVLLFRSLVVSPSSISRLLCPRAWFLELCKPCVLHPCNMMLLSVAASSCSDSLPFRVVLFFAITPCQLITSFSALSLYPECIHTFFYSFGERLQLTHVVEMEETRNFGLVGSNCCR